MFTDPRWGLDLKMPEFVGVTNREMTCDRGPIRRDDLQWNMAQVASGRTGNPDFDCYIGANHDVRRQRFSDFDES
jgi:hypothetical protein